MIFMQTRKLLKKLTSCVIYWHPTINCWWWSPINSCSCCKAPNGVSNSTRSEWHPSDYHRSPSQWQDQWRYHGGNCNRSAIMEAAATMMLSRRLLQLHCYGRGRGNHGAITEAATMMMLSCRLPWLWCDWSKGNEGLSWGEVGVFGEGQWLFLLSLSPWLTVVIKIKFLVTMTQGGAGGRDAARCILMHV